jgi:hypothetical protein
MDRAGDFSPRSIHGKAATALPPSEEHSPQGKRLIPLSLLSHKITFRVFPAKNACQAPKPPNSFKQNNIDVAY